MTRAVVLRRAARREFDDAALWYDERRNGLGAQFTAEIERALGLVAQNPERFPIMHRDVRCVRALWINVFCVYGIGASLMRGVMRRDHAFARGLSHELLG